MTMTGVDSASTLHYVTLDVFTTSRYKGNPLAIVHLPRDGPVLSQEIKQMIAREFNFSETVFLHQGLSEIVTHGDREAVRIDIFTPHEELPFAGHPTVGSGWYLSWRALKDSAEDGTRVLKLKTKAGEIPVTPSVSNRSGRESLDIRLQVPTDFKIHAPYYHPRLKSLYQTALDNDDYVNGKDYADGKGAEALASIVKGMTFLLMELKTKEALKKLRGFPERLTAPGLGEWDGFVGVYTFWEDKNRETVFGDDRQAVERVNVSARMFDGVAEDPATGSAASTLAGWLAKRRADETGKGGRWRFNITQGVDMGRESNITVHVEVTEDRRIGRIDLEGTAVLVMQGSLLVPIE